MKVIWLTDCHFPLEVPSFRRRIEAYIQMVATERPDAVLLGGDLCGHAYLIQLLSAFKKIVQAPIFFVLGNHDFIGTSVAAARVQVAEYVNRNSDVVWLMGVSEPVWLSEEVALIGADSLGDALVGNLSARNIRRRAHQFMYDEILDIKNLNETCKSDTVCIAQAVKTFLRTMGDEAANHLDRVGRIAAHTARRVWILLHAPPFMEATLYRGKPEPNGLPFFCAQAAGDVIRGLAETFPEVEFTVLAGHTHHSADLKILSNLRVFVHDPIGKGGESRWSVLLF